MPLPSEILAAREAAGMSQRAAGEACYHTLRAWQDWEYGHRSINPAAWAVFLHRTGQVKLLIDLAPRTDKVT